jgi:replicative DNA helicase
MAEDAVIGAVMLTDGRIIDDLDLTEADFHSAQAGFVYGAAQELRKAGKTVDLVTLMAAAKSDDTGRMVDVAWLHECAARTPSPSSAPFYADIVQEHALRRRLRVAATEVMDLANEPGDPVGIVDAARAAVERAGNVKVSGVPSFGELVDGTLDSLDKPPVYIPTVWPSLNQLIDGLRPGCVYVFGARPGIGKTVAALQLAIGLCRYGNVAFSSLEMSAEELQLRAISYDLKIDISRLMRRRLSETDWQKIAQKRAAWVDTPIFIDDNSARTIAQIKQHARNVARKGKLVGVVVDYLQLISAPRGFKGARYEVVSDVSRELKLMAKELHVPVIALAQLNREGAQRSDSRPSLTDLRDSGAIEQDADVVVLLHRDLSPGKSYELSMLVAKNRHGPNGHADFHFYGQFSEIREKAWSPTGSIQGNPGMDKTTD